MNLMQEDYGTRLSAVGTQGRLLLEAFCLIMAPAGGYPDEAMVGKQLGILCASRPELSEVINRCKRVNELSKSEVHLGVLGLYNGEKAQIISHSFIIASHIK